MHYIKKRIIDVEVRNSILDKLILVHFSVRLLLFIKTEALSRKSSKDLFICQLNCIFALNLEIYGLRIAT